MSRILALPPGRPASTRRKPFVHHGGFLLQVQRWPGLAHVGRRVVVGAALDHAHREPVAQARLVLVVGDLPDMAQLVDEELAGRRVRAFDMRGRVVIGLGAEVDQDVPADGRHHEGGTAEPAEVGQHNAVQRQGIAIHPPRQLALGLIHGAVPDQRRGSAGARQEGRHDIGGPSDEQRGPDGQDACQRRSALEQRGRSIR